MLKTLAIIGVMIIVAIAGVLLYAATKPISYRVQRTHPHRCAHGQGFPTDQRRRGMDHIVALPEEIQR